MKAPNLNFLLAAANGGRVEVNEVNALGGDAIPQDLEVVAVVKLVRHFVGFWPKERGVRTRRTRVRAAGPEPEFYETPIIGTCRGGGKTIPTTTAHQAGR